MKSYIWTFNSTWILRVNITIIYDLFFLLCKEFCCSCRTKTQFDISLLSSPLFAYLLLFLLCAGARVNAKDSMWLTPLHRAVASRSEVKKKKNVYFNLHPDYLNFFTCPWTVFWLFAEAAARVGLCQTTSCNCQLILNVTLQMSTSLACQNGLFPSGDRAVG